MKNKKFIIALLWLLQGIIVGFGAIMPGISGGTLCVAFGMYLPIMQTISHPFKNLKKYFYMLFIFFLGVGIGFVGLSGIAGYLMEANSTLVTCAFIGFILGTIPQLWNDAGAAGRSNGSYISIGAGFVILLTLLTFLERSNSATIPADFLGFILCGVLWGTSFIVPGLSSSTLLLFFGLYQPMLDGIASLDFMVLIPLFLGIAACVLLLSRAINLLYKKHYNIVYHFVIGVVCATVVMILPSWQVGAIDIFYQALCITVGALVSYSFTKICDNLKKDE